MSNSLAISDLTTSAPRMSVGYVVQIQWSHALRDCALAARTYLAKTRRSHDASLYLLSKSYMLHLHRFLIILINVAFVLDS
jgi:hypothetical protein